MIMRPRWILAYRVAIRVAFLAAGFSVATSAPGEEVVIDFEQVAILSDPTNDEIVTRVERWEDKGVEFKLAREPEKSAARGRIMFFPHLSSGHKGLINAMANEQEIPVQARFPRPVAKVTVLFWASTGTSAKLEAFSNDDQIVAHDEVKVVPGRKTPEDPVPMFRLSVEADEIAYVQFSGPRTGEFLAADEVRFTFAESSVAHDK